MLYRFFGMGDYVLYVQYFIPYKVPRAMYIKYMYIESKGPI